MVFGIDVLCLSLGDFPWSVWCGCGTAVTFNLRYPGQYYDAETGLHYNWHRYYDPKTGRYLTPDPIGLEGGLARYVYANGNPVMNTDWTGLRVLYCKRTVGKKDSRNGAVVPIFNHQYMCVIPLDGTKTTCDSNNPISTIDPDNDDINAVIFPSVLGIGSRGQDTPFNGKCKEIDDDEDGCFEACVLTQWEKKKPDYAIGPFGTDCQEYTKGIQKICEEQCP